MKPGIPTARRSRPLAAQIWTLHAYVGMLIAPSVIFFATTGVLQIYRLHEAHPGYAPPPLIEMLGSVHKDQRFALAHRAPAGDQPPRAGKPAPGAPSPAGGPDAGEARHSKAFTTLLKAFFTFVATGLIFSAVTGVWMALQQPSRRRAFLTLLLIGLLMPLTLAALTM